MHQAVQYAVLKSRKSPTLAYISSAADGTNQANAYTFTAQSIGTAAFNRYVVVAAAVRDASNTRSISATIGGVPAEILFTIDNTATFAGIGFFGLLVPTGTAADIVLTMTPGGLNADRAGIGVFTITGLNSTTPLSTGTDTATSVDMTITPSAVGDAIISVVGFSGAASNPWTWSGLTEDFDVAASDGPNITGAHVTATSRATITVAVTSGSGAGARGGYIVMR